MNELLTHLGYTYAVRSLKDRTRYMGAKIYIVGEVTGLTFTTLWRYD